MWRVRHAQRDNDSYSVLYKDIEEEAQFYQIMGYHLTREAKKEIY